jgi:ABC-type bacteriocin/lantibiotic exporter with double-glycine peptidase domain
MSTAQAFTTLALARFVSYSGLLYALPMMLSSASTFQRIEDFLQKDRFEDERRLIKGPMAIELSDIVLDIKSDAEPIPLNVAIPIGSITMLSGPVGCGKSTLLKAILGEVRLKSGEIGISAPYIGYCSQVLWLQNASLKKISSARRSLRRPGTSESSTTAI